MIAALIIGAALIAPAPPIPPALGWNADHDVYVTTEMNTAYIDISPPDRLDVMMVARPTVAIAAARCLNFGGEPIVYVHVGHRPTVVICEGVDF